MIVAEAILVPILVTTLPDDNNEDNSIGRVIKLVLLDYNNRNREKLLL